MYAFESCDLHKGKFYLKGDNVFRKETMQCVNYLQQEESLRKLPQGVRLGNAGGAGRRYAQHSTGTVDMPSYK